VDSLLLLCQCQKNKENLSNLKKIITVCGSLDTKDVSGGTKSVCDSCRSMRVPTTKYPPVNSDEGKVIQAFEEKMRKFLPTFSPDLVYNMDESGVQFCPTGMKVLTKTGTKHVAVTGLKNFRKRVTAVLAISQSGKTVPTMVIVKGATVPRELKSMGVKVVHVFSTSHRWLVKKTHGWM
jgi:hypothetical protein